MSMSTIRSLLRNWSDLKYRAACYISVALLLADAFIVDLSWTFQVSIAMVIVATDIWYNRKY